MTDLVDPDSYSRAWPGRPENAAAEARERAQRFRIDDPPDTPLPGFESPDETTERYSEPLEREVSFEAATARALLDLAAMDEQPATRAEMILAAQAWATLELANATRATIPASAAHAYRVDRETGAFTDLGPVS